MDSRLNSIAERVASRHPGSARTARDDEKALDMIMSHQGVFRNLEALLDSLKDDLAHAERSLTGIEREAGRGRAIVEAQKTFMPKLSKKAVAVKKFMDIMVSEMGKAL